MLSLNRNPLIYRAIRIHTRPKTLSSSLVVFVVLFVLTFAFIALGAIEHISYQDAETWKINWMDVFQRFSIFCLAVQVFLAFFITLGVMANSISSEKTRNTYEFFETLPIQPADKVIGLCLGKTLPIMVLTVILGISGVAFGAAVNIPMGNLLWLEAIVIIGYAASCLFGLTVSVGAGRSFSTMLITIISLFLSLVLLDTLSEHDFTSIPVWTLSPFCIFAATITDLTELPNIIASNNYHFFSMRVPWQLCPLVFYLFAAVFFFLGSRRALSRPSMLLTSQRLTMLSSLVLHVLLIGFLADTFRSNINRDDATSAAMIYLSIFFIMTLGWAMLTTPNIANAMQWVHRHKIAWPMRIFTHSLKEKETPPFVPMTGLWLLTVLAVLTINALYLHVLDPLILIVTSLLLLLFMLVYLCAFGAGTLMSRKSGKLIGLLFFLALLLIPTLFALVTIPRLEGLLVATPFAVIKEFCIYSSQGSNATLDVMVFYKTLGVGLAELMLFGGIYVCQLRRLQKTPPSRGGL